jgi:hypothetical protein
MEQLSHLTLHQLVSWLNSVSLSIYAALVLTWVAAYFCTWKGIRSIGVVAKFTVIVPWLFLIIMCIYNATLEGSLGGVRAYIGKWDLSVLNQGSTWSAPSALLVLFSGADALLCLESFYLQFVCLLVSFSSSSRTANPFISVGSSGHVEPKITPFLSACSISSIKKNYPPNAYS